jgi:hypothetical protein
LARSWNSHPEIIKTSGCSSDGYEKSQRAYLINAKENQISFALDASEKSPVVNPCFIIKGWNKKAEVLIDDKPLPEGKNFRQGLVRDTDGKLQLVVWIQKDSTKKIKFMFKN